MTITKTLEGVMWDVLVYQVGDNSLSEEMVWALKDMQDLGSSPPFTGKKAKVRIVSQFDLRGSKPQVYDSTEGGFPGNVDGNLSKLIKDIPETRIGKIATQILEFKRFVLQAAKSLSNEITSTQKKIGKKKNSSLDSLFAALIAQIQRLDTKPNLKKLKGLLEQAHGLDETPADLKVLIGDLQKAIAYVEDFCVENAASPEMVEEFIRHYAKDKDRYRMVVLSGHGSGALGDFLPDSTPRRSLSIPHLRAALEKATGYDEKTEKCRYGKIDILGMDSCLMSMAEVCHELKHVVEYLIGAEGWIQNTGWPYHRVLEVLKADHAIAPESLARRIVEVYNKYYQDYEVAGISTDLAVCRLMDMDNLCQAIGELAKSIEEHLGRLAVKKAVLLAHWEAQSYKYEQYVDLFDFCERLRFRLGNEFPSIRTNAENVMTAIRPWKEVNGSVVPNTWIQGAKRVVLKSCYTGPEFQYSYGLSIYFPWAASDFIPEYANLRFAESTGWAGFLTAVLDKTRREPRPGKGIPLDIGVERDPWMRSGDPSPRSGDPSPRSGDPSPRSGDPSPRSGDPSPRKKSERGSMKNPARKFHRHDCVDDGSRSANNTFAQSKIRKRK